MAGVVKLPENIFRKIKNSIPRQWMVCFVSALIVGFIAHFYKLTNWLPNWDSLVFRYDSQNMTELGRWFLGIVCSVSSYYDLPFLNGLISILFHALGAVCIVKTLNIKKEITAFLTGAIIVSFPTVTSVLMYNYVADGYGIAFFLSTLAAVLMTDKKPKYLLALFLICLSTAIYQAYITVTITLLIVSLLDKLIYQKEDIKSLIKKALKYALTGILGLALYYLILMIILKRNGIGLLDYQGISNSASSFSMDLKGSFYLVKEICFDYFFDFSKGANLFIILNVIIFVFTVSVYVTHAFKNKIFKSFSKILLAVLLIGVLLIGSVVLVFINPNIDYHNLMVMGYSIFYVFFIILYEKETKKKTNLDFVKNWGVLIISLVLILNQIVLSNVCYHKAQMAYEKSYGTLIRIADRIEQTKGSEKCNEILVIGALCDSEKYSIDFPPDMTGVTDGYIIRKDDEQVNQSVFCSALNDYCHKDYKFISGERKKELLKDDEIKNMSEWPEQGSIIVKDNIIVVNFKMESE